MQCVVKITKKDVFMVEKTDNTIGTIGGVATGWASYKYLPTIIRRPYSRWFMTECKSISQAEHNKYWQAAQQAFETSGLKDKGVSLIDLNSSNVEQVTKDAFDRAEKLVDRFMEKLEKKLKIKLPSKKTTAPKQRPKWKYILFGPDSDTKFKNALKTISIGENACYHHASKNVFVNKDMMGFSVFHEMGHAVNANSKSILKALSIGRHFVALSVPVLLITALAIRRKPEATNEPKSTQRKKNFLKDNIGILTFSCMIPTLIEEGLASINGAKLAKKVLNPMELKKLNITNIKAWSTYLLGVTLMGVFSQFAVKVKDKLVPPKEKTIT